MSKSHRLYCAALGGCLISLVALSWPVLGQNQPKTEQAPAQHQTDKQPVPVPDGAALRAIFEEAVKLYAAEKADNAASENRKERREESDLFAQWQQSRWARWAAIFAGLAFIANAVTVGLVFATFWETRRTAKAAITNQSVS